MLTEVRLQNVRCFREISLRLSPLTALVGPNASGKTALLQMLSIGPTGARDLRFRASDGLASVQFEYLDGRVLGRTWNQQSLHWGSSRLASSGEPKAVHSGQYLHLDVRAARKPRRVEQQGRLESDGSNLVNVIATAGRHAQDALAKQLSTLVPVLRDLDVRPGSVGEYRLLFQDRWNDAVWYEADEVSDGTILTLGLLATQYQSPAPDLIAIEEPEHGLHPYLLQDIVDVLRKLVRGEVGGRPVQIVLATQSAELLEFLEPDEVRFLTRDPETGEVAVEEPQSDSETWREAYEAHQRSLGSLWLSGGAGGVPGE